LDTIATVQTHLIFDMGNVLAFFDHDRACRQIAALGRAGTTEASVFDLLFHQPLERQYDTGEISTAEFIAALRAAFGITAPDDAVAHAWADIFEPNAELAAQLPALKTRAASLALASNTNELHYWKICSLMPETIALFDNAVLSYEVGYRKPAMSFFERMLAAAGGVAANCLYFDDRTDFVAAATTLGIRSVVYESGLNIMPLLVTV
jgi:putative hydrolase of the HAD superfamily